MRRILLAVLLLATACYSANLGVRGGMFSPTVLKGEVISGIDSLRVTFRVPASASVGLHCWFDDGAYADGDSVAVFWRDLASENDRTLPGVWTPISFYTAADSVNCSWLEFTDSLCYSSMVPDSLVGRGCERFAPVTGDAIELMFKTIAGDTIIVNAELSFK